MNTIQNDGADTAVINVYAVDKNGRRVPTADNFIEFNIEGGGKILGVGNGDPQCLEADNQQGRSLFNGCCQVLVQSKEGTEYIKLIAQSDNLKTAEYGKMVWDKSQYSNKQVETWRYYDSVISKMQEFLL